ncbi:hypothetical protein D9619_001389 [Psilocybe cf. subviscida]|uniref:Amidohydrolase 3 domain-containing protein n=1 Tax=Psilocybe cf. subviscida TaxID=2480587 RepID=A0A8H5F3C7_9AGAR|nr:hypothetical protein D9619_001389 [Psilocybe cf. subviscida]
MKEDKSGTPLSESENESVTLLKVKDEQTKGTWHFSWPLVTGFLSVALTFLYTNWETGANGLQIYAICSAEGAQIYQVNNANSHVQCVLVKGAYIAATGSLEEIKEEWDRPTPSTILRRLFYGNNGLEIRTLPPGAIAIPGISDSHAHILEYGATQQLPLEEAKSIPDAVRRVRDFILANPDVKNDTSKVIIGGGWDHTVWPSVGWPTAADLDADSIVRGRPVILQSKDCHALWASSRAIQISLPLPESVEGGVIVRDANANPSGVFLDNAQDLLKQPKLTENDLMRRFNVAVRDALKYGITSIHDAGLDPMSLAFFKRQAEIGALPIRIYGMTYFDETKPYWGNTTKPIIGANNGRLNIRSVKVFADGALRTGGSALYEPYADNPTTNGFMRIDTEVLNDIIPKFLKDGWQVNVHAIGDRANGIVIDAFEAAFRVTGVNVTALRPRLEHAQMMTDADMARLGKLGVIASVQPTHAISDMWYAQDRLGPERVKQLYAFRSLVDKGARIALGSDFPVESMNPLSGFYAAITRKSPKGESPHGPGGWFPEQILTRQEALRGMTIDAAYASFTESTLGSIEVGKRADFTILSRDIMSIPVEDILGTQVHATIIDGKAVYGQI